jgi:hypothetical protein
VKQIKPDVVNPARDGWIPEYQPGKSVPHLFSSIGQVARIVPPDPVKRAHIGVDVNVAVSQELDDV